VLGNQLRHTVTADAKLRRERRATHAASELAEEKLDTTLSKQGLRRHAIHERIDVAGLTGTDGRTATGEATERQAKVLADRGSAEPLLRSDGLDRRTVGVEPTTEDSTKRIEINRGTTTGRA
jgi:hypothetical protein